VSLASLPGAGINQTLLGVFIKNTLTSVFNPGPGMAAIKRIFTCSFYFLLLFYSASAQLGRHDLKTYKKAKVKYDLQNYDKAEKELRPLSVKYSHSADVWNLLAQVQLMNYYRKTENEKMFNFSTAQKQGSGEITETLTNDSLTGALMRMLNDSRPSKIYLKKSADIWREATLKCEGAELPSLLLRSFFLEVIHDSTPSPDASIAFNRGEAAFQIENFTEAINDYQKAIDLDSTFYKARLYMGDAYYSKQEYVVATRYFREAVRLQPGLLEPRKFLVDALVHMHALPEAKKEAVDALIVYPDVGMFLKLEEISKAGTAHFERHWMERGVFPNTVGDQPLNEKGDRDWMEYINGFSLIEKYCNKEGIVVRKNELTKSHYAEVYSWEYMLSKTSTDKFLFARKMQQAGFLDCYVMLTEYHFDFHAQYQHFAKHNKERLRSYVDLLMSM
jgi:tetratricopeptide (TPR) repeat protein